MGFAALNPSYEEDGWPGPSPAMTNSDHLLPLQPLRGVERGVHDALVAGAAAQIARDGDAHLLLGRIGIVAQELEQSREHAGRAEAALQAVIVAERLLQRMQLLVARRDALDGEDVVAVRLHREHQAGARRIAVEQDGAGAAHAVLAAEMGAGQAEIVADEIRQRDADLDLLLVPLAVDGQRDGSLQLGHSGVPCVSYLVPGRCRALPDARLRLLERAP